MSFLIKLAHLCLWATIQSGYNIRKTMQRPDQSMKLVPTKNSSRPCGIRRYRAIIVSRAACRLNSTLGLSSTKLALYEYLLRILE
jgi:hypothetical protein